MGNTKELNNIPFFYILSMGRSGSTLLEFLLDAHPNVNIPLESRFIIHLFYKYGSKTNWTIENKKEFLKDLYQDEKLMSFWEFDKNRLENDILNTNSSITFFELCRIITANYISFFPKEEITIQGSKNPIYSLWVDILYELNKQTKFIHLVRNPMGVAASNKKLGKNKHIYIANRWNLMNKQIEKVKEKAPNNFITIKYETLLLDSESTLQSICNFLNINFLPQQLRFNESIANHLIKIENEGNVEKIAIFNSHLKNLVNPIQPKISESWKTILTSQEKKDIAYITQDLSMKYGYNLNFEKANFSLEFYISKIYNQYRHIKHRLFYRSSLSISK